MILYIGNKLSKHGNTPTSVEVLGESLKEVCDIVSVSDKQNKLARLADMLYSIFKYRKQTSYILIDTYSTSNFYYALMCAVLAKGFGIDYIPILHGGNLPQRVQSNPTLSNLLFGNAYINVAPSYYLLDSFKAYGYDVKYIPNSIDISMYEYKPREDIKPKLLYVRAFSKIYNPQMAIYTVAKLLKRYPQTMLCMVGPDKDGTLQECKDLAKELDVEKHIRFMGKMQKEDWIELSKEYDIFINTTNYDNTPVSVMEAMALGMPVVSTNVGGIPYLLQDREDALLVDANDDKAMVEMIIELIDNIDISKGIVVQARQKVEGFDWNMVKKQWIDLFEGEKK
jgi:glycosyltransferase involved in cell wall biosynthesis